MPGCPPKVKSGPDLLIYTHLPPAERERYSSEASTTTTSIVQRFERGLNEVGVTVTQCSPLSILATSNQVECRFTVEQEETELGRCSLLGGCKVGVAVGGARHQPGSPGSGCYTYFCRRRRSCTSAAATSATPAAVLATRVR